MVRRNYAKSFDGFQTRKLSKITDLTIIQYAKLSLSLIEISIISK